MGPDKYEDENLDFKVDQWVKELGILWGTAQTKARAYCSYITGFGYAVLYLCFYLIYYVKLII